MADDKDIYVLGRSAAESQRLEDQFVFLTKAAGGLLYHPALSDLSQFKAVLDCGAGTLAWDRAVLKGGVSEAHPVRLPEDAVLEACDISDAQFRDKPSGLNDVFLQDVQQPFPKAKHEKYDLISQRLVRLGIERGKWPEVLQNLKAALRDGGQLNILEASHLLVSMEGKPLSQTMNDFIGMWDTMVSKSGSHTRIFDDLPRLIEEAGFGDLQIHRFLLPLGVAGAKHAGLEGDYKAANEENSRGMLRAAFERNIKDGVFKDAEQARRTLEGAFKEIGEVPMAMPCAYFLAKKPASS